MSPITSTKPFALYRLNEPSAPSATTARLGVAPGSPPVTLRLLASGRGWSAGHAVRYVDCVALGAAVRLMTIDVAVAGTVHEPCVPHTASVIDSPGPSGVSHEPTDSGAGRVSNRRHGVIGT